MMDPAAVWIEFDASKAPEGGPGYYPAACGLWYEEFFEDWYSAAKWGGQRWETPRCMMFVMPGKAFPTHESASDFANTNSEAPRKD